MTTNINFPNSVVQVLDASLNSTSLQHNATTGLGLNVSHNFTGVRNCVGELFSDSVNFTDTQPDGTVDNNVFAYATLHRNTNSVGNVRDVLLDNVGLVFTNNQGATNNSTTYSSDQLFTNQSYTVEATIGLQLNAPTIDVTGQCDFIDYVPHCDLTPTLGNDLANKGYVDSLVGQYSGGYNLYLNFSVTDGSYKSLGQVIVDTTQQTVVNVTDGALNTVASFVSAALGVIQIPAGLWNVLLWGKVNSTNGDVHYSCKLYTFDGTTETEIGASAISADIKAVVNPAAYPLNITLAAPVTIALTTKVIVRIFVQSVGSPSSRTVTTYFQNQYYSFVQSTLNAGTTLLSSTNTWTGSNTYSLGINAPSINNTGTLQVGSTSTTNNVLGSTISINNTNASANIVNLGSAQSTINSFPIKPASAITYYDASGTNIPGTIGHIYNKTTTGSGGFDASGAYKQCASIGSVPPGVYVVQGNVALSRSGTVQSNYNIISISPTSDSIIGNYGAHTQTFTWVNGNHNLHICCVIALTATTTIYLQAAVVNVSGTGGWSISTVVFKAVRIA